MGVGFSMKNWLKNLIKLDSKPKVSLIENFRTIYSHFLRLLGARREALQILKDPDRDPRQDLALPLGVTLESLNLIGNTCSLDLVRVFQQIQKLIQRNPDQKIGAAFFQTLHANDFPNAGPFPRKELLSLPDLLDYGHELAIEGMFDLLDRYDPSWGKAKKVQSGLPINLHVMDLDGGISEETDKKLLPREKILSRPMQALFRGMVYPGITWSGPIGVNLKGLMVIMAQSSSRPEEDFWDKTYALLSRDYMNYNSRLGYHYNSVEAYVSEVPENNHIRFMFKGGAADDIRRARRARFIGAVLENMDFEVVVQKDLVEARLLRKAGSLMEHQLDLIGRLMGCVRQRDMVMNNESIVSWHIEAFLRGNYCFDPNK